MAPRKTGKYVHTSLPGETVEAFVPHPLPPSRPALVLSGPTHDLLQQAERSLARLEMAAEMVPSLEWFIYAFVRKEAVLSSQIEGTQATLIDLFNHEAADAVNDVPADLEVQDICNYLDALNYARKQIASKSGLPISMRLLNQTHRRLMRGARGGQKLSGSIRRSQNWIGGTRPGNAAFEKYLHGSSNLPPLVRAGLLHVQFETIHPYLDGNGRIGRLLISLLLEAWGLLSQPVLYLSLFFKRHRDEYYRRLGAVRTDGDWEGWIDFFLEGVGSVAEEAVVSSRELFALVAADRERVLALPNATVATLRFFELLPRHPIVTIGLGVRELATTKPTVGRAVDTLVEAGLLVEMSGRKRDRTWGYRGYLDRLREGTELGR